VARRHIRIADHAARLLIRLTGRVLEHQAH
jgi:hypothetical protein